MHSLSAGWPKKRVAVPDHHLDAGKQIQWCQTKWKWQTNQHTILGIGCFHFLCAHLGFAPLSTPIAKTIKWAITSAYLPVGYETSNDTNSAQQKMPKWPDAYECLGILGWNCPTCHHLTIVSPLELVLAANPDLKSVSVNTIGRE